MVISSILKNPEIIDEVMVSVLRAPKTFTREDTVEINCHGGIVPTNKILQVLLTNGARLAEPGNLLSGPSCMGGSTWHKLNQ